jgi:hypothetical protein
MRLHHAGSLISNASWRSKLAILFCFFAVFVLAVGAAGAVALHMQSRETQSVVGSALARLDAATRARMSIIEIDRALTDLIAQSEPDAIRTAAVASIRGAPSLAGRGAAKAERGNPDSEQVNELLSANDLIKGPRMQIIQMGRKNDDAAALALVGPLGGPFKKIDELSLSLLQQAQDLLSRRLNELEEQERRITRTLGVGIGVGLLLGALACWWGGNLLVRPLRHLQEEIERLSRRDLCLRIGKPGRDEWGLTLQALSVTGDNLRRILSGMQRVLWTSMTMPTACRRSPMSCPVWRCN